MKLWTIFFLSQIAIKYIHGDTTCPKKICRCSKKRQTATCFNLSYIPEVPHFVRSLELSNNSLNLINRKSFINISGNQIQRLSFSRNNSIRAVSVDAFEDLKYLRTLEINDEEQINPESLKKSFSSLNRSIIRYIGLENNGWKFLPMDFFSYLNGTSIDTISLNDNKFINFSGMLLQPFSKIHKLYIKNNEIVFINADGMQRLEHLDLSSNNIYKIPVFCDSHNTSLVPRLLALTLFDNAVRKLRSTSFKCLERLHNLILDRNRINKLEDGVLSEMVNLRRLSIKMTPQLRNLSPGAFNSFTLSTLQFVQNGFRFDQLSCSGKLFKNLPELTTLDLSKNYLPNNASRLREMFSNLPKLTTLNLHASFLSILPDGLLQRLPRLETLILQGNKLERWNNSVFENLTSLKQLNLDGNYIHIINESSFPNMLWMSLKKLDLSHNDFWCTCEQKWFIDFLRSTNVTQILINWPKLYACAYPEERKRLLLQKYTDVDADCEDWSPFFTIIIVSTSSVFFIFCVVITAFRCQTNIRNTVYLLRVYARKKKGYIKLKSPDDFDFDAFVVYCDSDRQWVHGVLLKRLENKGLKICVHHRDFDIGEPITDNIERYIDRSWKIVVVMSNNFTKSEWCQWEIDLIQERRRRYGKDALILIMFRQIDTNHMTSSVKALLDTTSHLTYQEGFGEDLFWTAVMNSVTKAFTEPPTAVL